MQIARAAVQRIGAKASDAVRVASATIPGGPVLVAAGTKLVKASPVLVAAGVGGAAGWAVTGALQRNMPRPETARPAHAEALFAAGTPIPAMVVGGLGVAGAVSSASALRTITTRRVVNAAGTELASVTTNSATWRLGSRLGAASSLGVIAGAALAAGFAKPIIDAARGLGGAAVESAVRGVTPDWLEQGADSAKQWGKDVADTFDLGPSTDTYHGRFERPVNPETIFEDGMTLNVPDDQDSETALREHILDTLEQQGGTRPVRTSGD